MHAEDNGQTNRVSRLKLGGLLGDSLKERIAYWEERKGTEQPLLKLEEVVKCHHSLGSHPDVLLCDESDNLYLEHTAQWFEDSDGNEVIGINADPCLHSAPITALRKGQLEPVSVREALKWFVKANEWMDSYDGDIGELCRIAAKKIKELERTAAN